jgi:hypothetical protein
MAAGRRYIAFARTAQKTTVPTVPPLLRVTQLLSSSGCFSESTVLALSKYAIVLFLTRQNKQLFFLFSKRPKFCVGDHRPIVILKNRGGPGSRTGSMWGLWWTKRHWSRFSPSTLVSPANHSTDFSIIIIT